MALDGNNSMFMPVEPANGGFGDMGGMWLVLLFILLLGGGFGGGFGGNNGLYPFMNQTEQITQHT